jgi:hypothetical protein
MVSLVIAISVREWLLAAIALGVAVLTEVSGEAAIERVRVIAAECRCEESRPSRRAGGTFTSPRPRVSSTASAAIAEHRAEDSRGLKRGAQAAGLQCPAARRTQSARERSRPRM